MTIFVTGGNGFIGSNFITDWCDLQDELIVNIDLCTYAGSEYINSINSDKLKNYTGKDINDDFFVKILLEQYKPRAIIHFAAESHVDNSILDPFLFLKTNIMGTANLLECIKSVDKSIKFIHVSTDEVFGSLSESDLPATENSPYKPNSPYSASKAASDHIVRAYHKTYGLQTITTNCSNNYGKFQHKEKFIPTVIKSCLNNTNIPIYGNGMQIRDWLFVSDHCSALRLLLNHGIVGETYNIGGDNQFSNLQVVNFICSYLNEIKFQNKFYEKLISFVDDRPGHDLRYNIDCSKLKQLGWTQTVKFEDGIKNTIDWYLQNE
jgi:dTDP-glucose 4,6-dehydratase